MPEIADYLSKISPSTLLLAAGGIADGRGLAAALMLGVDGAAMGSRFWASEEALTPPAATDRAICSSGDDTVRTRAIDALPGVPWPDEFSFRVLKNKFTEQCGHRETEVMAAFGSLVAAYAVARSRQDFDIAAVVVGECVGLTHDRPAAESIIKAIVTQAQSLLEQGATLNFERR